MSVLAILLFLLDTRSKVNNKSKDKQVGLFKPINKLKGMRENICKPCNHVTM